MGEYLFTSADDAEKLKDNYQERINTDFTDAKTHKKYTILLISILPAHPERRNAIWNMLVSYLNKEYPNIDYIWHYRDSMKETQFILGMISIEKAPVATAHLRLDILQQMVNQNGELGYDFPILME